MDTNSFILCQPDESKSCGACCGLYNYVDSSRFSLTERLRARTKRFHETVRNKNDIEYYSSSISAYENMEKRYEVIHCCEYLGFLDSAEKRVGCLLHPAQNSGLDLRDVSFYGHELCAGHLCPSHHFISKTQSQILIKIIDDWYLYGLCITDIDLVNSYFRLLADHIGEEIKPQIFNNKKLKQISCQYFDWKITWPFRSPDTNRLGKYYFDGSQYMISYINYEEYGRDVSRFNAIFLSLSSVFKSAEEIEEAESLISSNIDNFIHTYQRIF
jgi:hypothetical protein